MVDEFPQAQVPGERGRQEQPGIGHQAVVVEGDLDAVGLVLWQHLSGALFLGPVFCFKTIIPDSEAHPLASSRAVPKAVLRWIRGKGRRIEVLGIERLRSARRRDQQRRFDAGRRDRVLR